MHNALVTLMVVLLVLQAIGLLDVSIKFRDNPVNTLIQYLRHFPLSFSHKFQPSGAAGRKVKGSPNQYELSSGDHECLYNIL